MDTEKNEQYKNKYGILILFKSFNICIGFLVQNKIKSTSEKLILFTNLGLKGFLTSKYPSFQRFTNQSI